MYNCAPEGHGDAASGRKSRSALKLGRTPRLLNAAKSLLCSGQIRISGSILSASVRRPHRISASTPAFVQQPAPAC